MSRLLERCPQRIAPRLLVDRRDVRGPWWTSDLLALAPVGVLWAALIAARWLS